MQKRYQGGSLVGFIVVGVLLALVLIGGLYGLNRYNAQKAAETAEEKSDKGASTDVAKTDETKEDSKSEKKPTDGDQPSSQTTVTQPTDSTQRGGTVADSNSSTAEPTGKLPQTGPADTAAQLLAITSLALATTYYVRSRSRT
jgi:LPXTG-motif cell wall-anchored protein